MSASTDDRSASDTTWQIVRHGDLGQRARLAADESGNVPREVLLALINDPEPAVWGAIASNLAASADVLDALARSRPEILPTIETHPHLGQDRMLALRCDALTGAQQDTFFNRVQATDEERQQFNTLIDIHAPWKTVAQVWAIVRPT